MEEENIYSKVSPLYSEEASKELIKLKKEIYISVVKPLFSWILKRPYVIVLYGLVLLGMISIEILKTVLGS